MLDTDRLGNGDLYMVNPIAVPDWLEQTIREAKGHNILHRLLPEEMVDAEDLFLAQIAPDPRIQLARRVDAVAKWLFDNDAAPTLRRTIAQLFIQQAGVAELLDKGSEEAIGNRKVE